MWQAVLTNSEPGRGGCCILVCRASRGDVTGFADYYDARLHPFCPATHRGAPPPAAPRRSYHISAARRDSLVNDVTCNRVPASGTGRGLAADASGPNRDVLILIGDISIETESVFEIPCHYCFSDYLVDIIPLVVPALSWNSHLLSRDPDLSPIKPPQAGTLILESSYKKVGSASIRAPNVSVPSFQGIYGHTSNPNTRSRSHPIPSS